MESFKLKPTISYIQSYPLCVPISTCSFLRLITCNSNRKPTSISCSSKQNPNNRISKRPNLYYNFKRYNPLCAVATVLQSVKRLVFAQTQKWISRLESYSIESEHAFNDCEVNGYSQNGAFGVAILSMTSTARGRLSPLIATLAANPTFVSGLCALFMAQSLKVFLNFWVERKWDFGILFASGGMPSSHSALCTALTTSVALCHGVADSLFPVCLGFSLIVMYDAIGVRRHAGMQAEVLNMIVADLFQGHPISQRKLKELLGHTPSQVVAGAMLGILVACFCCQGFLVAT